MDTNSLFDLSTISSSKTLNKDKSNKKSRKKKISQTVEVLDSVFGEDFNIKQPPIKQVNLEDIDISEFDDDDAKKYLKRKSIPLSDKLILIKDRVLKKLGKQKDNIVVLSNKIDFHNYVSDAIKSGRIAIDTETNNSLDPITCKIMGLCLYYPGGKQAYIPINHISATTGEKLPNQCTETDIKEELQRVNDSGIIRIMHNGKFDYQVIKCTCGIAVPPDWDTMIAAKLIDENEQAGLKEQYIKYIDPSQSKYDISMLFADIPYAVVDPGLFALYAATDSLMTDKLYMYQKPILEACGSEVDQLSGKELKGVYWLFKNIEMPIVVITAEMELTGVSVDLEYGARLKEKYIKLVDDTTASINKAISDLKPSIDNWLLDPKSDARLKTKIYVPAKTKMTFAKIQAAYPEIDENGVRFKWGTPKADQLTDPINISSPVQLAILFYDVLKCPATNKKTPRGTGKEELKALKDWLKIQIGKQETLSDDELEESFEEEAANDMKIEAEVSINNKKTYTAAYDLCNLILTLRGYTKLLTTYIETIPTLAEHWPDHRIRFHLNSVGTNTGRYSSGGKIKYYDDATKESVTVSGINIQNIPSHAKNIRLLFVAKTENHEAGLKDNYYEIPETDEVETAQGWKFCNELKIGDIIVGKDNQDVIKNIIKQDKLYLLYI